MDTGKKTRANKYLLSTNVVTIKSGFKKNLVLEFAGNYDTEDLVEEILFNDIILDAEEYEKNKDEYKDKTKLEVNF